MFLSGDGERTIKTVPAKEVFEKIDFKKWLFESRWLIYEVIHRGLQLHGFELKVRGLRYNGKVYAFDIERWAGDARYLQIPLLVEEKSIISSYQIAIDANIYRSFVKRYFEISIDKLDCASSDDLFKTIIDFINEVFEKGEVFPENDMYYNLWRFDIYDFDAKEDEKNVSYLNENFKPFDIVKLFDKNNNITHYGIMSRFYPNTKSIFSFRCYDLDYYGDVDAEKSLCEKYFLPPLGEAENKNYKFEKAEVTELNEKQRKYYEDTLNKLGVNHE